LVGLLNENSEFCYMLGKILGGLKRTDNVTVKLMQRVKEESTSVLFFYNLVLDVYIMLKKVVSLSGMLENIWNKNRERASEKSSDSRYERLEFVIRDLRRGKAEGLIKGLEVTYNLNEAEIQQDQMIMKPKAARKNPNHTGGRRGQKFGKAQNPEGQDQENATFENLESSLVKNKTILYFLIKEKSNLCVDLARLSYTRIMENIFEIFEDIKKSLRLQDIKLLNNANRGYHLKIGKKSLTRISIAEIKAKLEDTVINISEKNATLLFSTVS
jgi:hypothetical protein